MSLKELINTLPKVELHLHIEGSLEPELMMQLAKKNAVELPYDNIQQVRSAYQFDDLQSFLDLYYFGASVLLVEDDYYQLMLAYLKKCDEDNVVHTEIMFDPQTHTERGIGFEVFMPGFLRAIEDAQAKSGISVLLIMSFLRHLSEYEAINTLNQAKPYLSHISAVGLDSSEVNNPPEKFKNVFALARGLGLKCVAHAGEEGPPEYIYSAINNLQVDRIDHGVRCVEDPELVALLIEKKMPLTVCPLSNVKLCVFDNMQQHNILDMLEKGLVVTVNADDPSYFGGYMNDNFHAMAEALPMTKKHVIQLVENSFKASFLEDPKKQILIKLNLTSADKIK
jgi:adenosine deaminase